MIKVLVTGSNGLLGQKLTERILNGKDFDLIATNRGTNKFSTERGYVFEEMDINNYEQVEAVVKKHKPNVIIHTAAITNVDTCHTERGLCWQTNVSATSNLGALCEQLNIHFIYISTDFVFDGLNGPYKEDDKPLPVSYYGESKLAAENVVTTLNCKWTIIRTILVYGILNDLSRSNIVLWVKTALENKQPINVVNDQWRMPTLVEDLAEACLIAANKTATGIFHISGKDMMTVADIANNVASFWNLDKAYLSEISSSILNQEAKRPVKTGFVLDKSIAVLGYQPHSFTEGLGIVNNQITRLNLLKKVAK